MRYYTHLAFSFLCGIFLVKYLPISNQILFIALFLLFSLIPDIDKVGSKVSEKAKLVSWLINFFVGHRGLFHSLWLPIILYMLLFMMRMDIAIAASFGYLSHLILDCFTVSGIKLLWPLQKKVRGFLKSGGLTEYFIFVLLVIVDFYFLVNL
jgi:inner membrane protein